MNPDHHRSPRAIETRRPQIEIKAVFRLHLLDLHRRERLSHDRVLRSSRAEAPSVANASPWLGILGGKPPTGALRSRCEWHTLEDQQSVLFIAFELSIAGRYDRTHLLYPRR